MRRLRSLTVALGLLCLGRGTALAYGPLPVAVVSAPATESMMAQELGLLGKLLGVNSNTMAKVIAQLENARLMLQTINEVAALGRRAKQAYDYFRNYTTEDFKRDARTALYTALPELQNIETELDLAMANAKALEAGPAAFFAREDYHDARMQKVVDSGARLAFRSMVYPVVFPEAMQHRPNPTEAERLVQYHFRRAGMAFRRSYADAAMVAMGRKVQSLVAEAERKKEKKIDLGLAASTAQSSHQTMNNTQFLRDAKEAEIAREEAADIAQEEREAAVRETLKAHGSGALFGVGVID